MQQGLGGVIVLLLLTRISSALALTWPASEPGNWPARSSPPQLTGLFVFIFSQVCASVLAFVGSSSALHPASFGTQKVGVGLLCELCLWPWSGMARVVPSRAWLDFSSLAKRLDGAGLPLLQLYVWGWGYQHCGMSSRHANFRILEPCSFGERILVWPPP